MASKNQKPKTNQTSQVAKPAPNRGPNPNNPPNKGPNTHNAPNKGHNNHNGPNNAPNDGKNPAPKKVGYDDGFTHLTGFEAVLHGRFYRSARLIKTISNCLNVLSHMACEIQKKSYGRHRRALYQDDT